jgi:hypothetical protein
MHSRLNDWVSELHGFDSETNKDKPLYLKVGG